MRTVLSLLPVAVLVVCGCESEPGPVPVYPVSGQVLYAGKPAAGVHVYFNAAGGTPTPVNPHAVTGPDGKFTLSTYADEDGAPEGSYQVLMTCAVSFEWAMPYQPSSRSVSGGSAPSGTSGGQVRSTWYVPSGAPSPSA